MDELMTTFRFRDEEQKKDFKMKLAERGESQQEVIVKAIDRYIFKGKEPKVEKKLAPPKPRPASAVSAKRQG